MTKWEKGGKEGKGARESTNLARMQYTLPHAEGAGRCMHEGSVRRVTLCARDLFER